MRIFVDVSNAALCAEILDVLVRAGHAIERGVVGRSRARARGQPMFPTTWSADELVDWIYRELFLMPPGDPALGLDIEEPF